MSFEKLFGFRSFGDVGTVELEPGPDHLLSPGQALGQARLLDEYIKPSYPL